MTCAAEFSVVDLIVQSNAETRGVDAFALSLIKAERQMRRLFTHLVFQSPAFGPEDVLTLRAALGSSRKCYFEGFERGIEDLSTISISRLVGVEHDALRDKLRDAIDIRNKIFHGQVTDRCLTREILIELVNDIRYWCELLCEGANREIGYDGFQRNSYSKSPRDLAATYRVMLDSVDAYRRFLADHVERR